MIRGFPNGATHRAEMHGTHSKWGRTRGTETSKYPQEKKTKVIPQVAASERGGAQTGGLTGRPGL